MKIKISTLFKFNLLLALPMVLLLGYNNIAMAQSRAFLFNNGINYMLADKEKAIEQLTKAIEIDSNFSAAYFYRGIASFKLGSYENAINDFNRVSSLDSTIKVVHMYKGFAYKQLGKTVESLASFTEYMKSQTKLTAIDYNIIGRAKMDVGDLKGAISDFEAALEKDNTEAQYYYLFTAFYGNKNYPKALEQIDLAIEENNDFYGYYINRGNTKLMLGKFEQAITDYDYALALEPDVPDTYFLRGRALDTLKMHESAISDFDRAIALNPDDGTYYSKRGNARYAGGNRSGACMDWTIAGSLGYYEDFDKIKSLCE